MRHKTTILTAAIAIVVAAAFLVPAIPVLQVVDPPLCGTPPVTCHASSLYLASPIHYFFGVGGYYQAISEQNSSQWHYGFDL